MNQQLEELNKGFEQAYEERSYEEQLAEKFGLVGALMIGLQMTETYRLIEDHPVQKELDSKFLLLALKAMTVSDEKVIEMVTAKYIQLVEDLLTFVKNNEVKE